MADIFDEIDEELKQDRTKELWTRYGKFVIAAAAAVVIGVGASQGYSAFMRSQAETAANLYQQALTSDDSVAALESRLGDLTDGYAMLGRFQIAAGLAKAGDLAGAEAGYLAISSDSSVAPLYRDAALLMSAMNAPQGADAGDLQQRIAPLADGAGPWKGLALELSAAFDLQQGQADAALSKLETIVELAETSPELRQRAARLVDILKS
jgi:hypothetical protein